VTVVTERTVARRNWRGRGRRRGRWRWQRRRGPVVAAVVPAVPGQRSRIGGGRRHHHGGNGKPHGNAARGRHGLAVQAKCLCWLLPDVLMPPRFITRRLSIAAKIGRCGSYTSRPASFSKRNAHVNKRYTSFRYLRICDFPTDSIIPATQLSLLQRF
jgi:hypothetical protein